MPWCPKCKSEYREGFTQCSDCLSDLVDNLPEEDEEVCLTNNTAFDESNAKEKSQKRARLIIPSQYYQSLVNVTAFLIVYIKCCDIIQNVLNKIVMLFYYSSIGGVLDAFLLPIVFNIAYFMGMYAILNQTNIKKYLTPRNILINASLSLICLIVRYTYLDFLLFVFDYELPPGIYNLARFVFAQSLLKILVLAIIYILTIRKVPLKSLLFTKMAGCFYLLMVLLTVAQGLYNSYISSGMTIMTDYSFPIIQLYLLWFSVTTSEKREEL